MKKILKSPFLWAFFIGIASLHFIKEMAMLRRAAPEPLVFVGDWSLINQDAKPFGAKDSSGKVVIADYFFTSCPSICPKLTEAMKEVHVRFQDQTQAVAFVSITVDPERDTPEVLKAFMEKNGFAHDNWYGLTGARPDIYHVVVNQMKIHVGEKEAFKGSDTYDIPHLGELALFDQTATSEDCLKPKAWSLRPWFELRNFF